MKLIELEKKDFDTFVRTHKTKSHFLQSLAWGEFSKKEKRLSPYYMGLVNDKEEIVAATLLLKKLLPCKFCYFYAPRGFVIDYNDKDLVAKMTQEIVTYAKSKKAIFIKIDPDIIYKSYNHLDEENSLPYNSNEIFKTIRNCGFKHLGFTKDFGTMQPRYTFRINLEQSLEEIEAKFSKTTKQRIAKAKKLGVQVNIGTYDDIEEFYKLMILTESRKDFVTHNKEYYKSLYKIFNEDNKATLFLGKVNITNILNVIKENLETIKISLEEIPTESMSKSAKNKQKELLRQQENLERDLNKYSDALDKYGEEITLSAHWIIEYADKAWVLYAGNHNILSETYANYLTYYEHLKFCKDRGLKIYDQFGTIGDLSKNNPRLGLHEFKKKFGGDYIEFLGEFDYILNKPIYFTFTKLVPIYRNMIKRKSKKEMKHEADRNK